MWSQMVGLLLPKEMASKSKWLLRENLENEWEQWLFQVREQCEPMPGGRESSLWWDILGKWGATHISVQLYIWGLQCSSCQAQFSEHMRQTGNSCLGEKGLANSGQQFTCHNSKIYLLCFFCQSEFGKEGTTCSFYLPFSSRRPRTDIWESWLW